MKNSSFTVAALAFSSFLTGCTVLPNEAYYNHGQPEKLMEVSKEEVRLDIASKASVKHIMNVVAAKEPATASIKCDDASVACNKLEQSLEKKGISTTRVSSKENVVTLTYNNVVARACVNRYMDNPVNPYNLNYPTFGCTLSMNMATMVTDKHEFTDPRIMDNADASKGAQAVDLYRTAPKQITEFSPIVTSDSIASSSGTR